jgi:hypothetical protein
LWPKTPHPQREPALEPCIGGKSEKLNDSTCAPGHGFRHSPTGLHNDSDTHTKTPRYTAAATTYARPPALALAVLTPRPRALPCLVFKAISVSSSESC